MLNSCWKLPYRLLQFLIIKTVALFSRLSFLHYSEYLLDFRERARVHLAAQREGRLREV